jgi:hypothetical protein
MRFSKKIKNFLNENLEERFVKIIWIKMLSAELKCKVGHKKLRKLN